MPEEDSTRKPRKLRVISDGSPQTTKVLFGEDDVTQELTLEQIVITGGESVGVWLFAVNAEIDIVGDECAPPTLNGLRDRALAAASLVRKLREAEELAFSSETSIYESARRVREVMPEASLPAEEVKS